MYICTFSAVDQKQYQVDISGMLEDEVAWLSNFVPTEHPDLMDTDNMLLAGHLKLIKTLFTCEGICKEEYGNT
jgi:ubiquitin carboxyl-terminal hydrolase 9/24